MSHSSSTTGSTMAELASLLAAGLFLLGMGGSMLKNAATQTRIYTPDESAFPNAQIGYAPMTDSAYAQDSLLRYVELRWREVEPQEGVYAWDALDAQYGFRDLRARGIHLVVRFVCDVPGQESHMDIPDWLYAQTGDGSWYSTDYGKGYSPDYSNATFRAAHRRVLAALGEHFGTDGFVTYVELGSLGHWGEWHIKTGEGLVPMPGEAIRDEYVADYEAAFPTAKLLMRRPFNITAAHGLGVYNDMTGHEKDTAEWLGWLQNGGWYGEEPNALAPMPAFWQKRSRGRRVHQLHPHEDDAPQPALPDRGAGAAVPHELPRPQGGGGNVPRRIQCGAQKPGLPPPGHSAHPHPGPGRHHGHFDDPE